MGTTNKTIQRFGLTEIYTPSPANAPLVDVVFVHGLNGDPHDTWTSTPSKVFWPADLLPQFVDEQKVRVLVYGYDADVTSLAGSGTTKDRIHNHAERLVADLFANRRIRKATERPIIFVAHSLGGLVVKRALIYSHEISGVRTEHLRSIFVSTYGILFLATPHKGADIASWGSFLEWLCRAVPKKAVDTSPQLIDALKTNSETLQNIDRQFAQLIESFHLFFFHEAKPTDLKGTLRFIVEEDSAAPTLPDVERAGIQADHSHICKFESENSPGFDLVVDGIQRYAEDAPETIRSRWTAEQAERKTQRLRKAQEIFPGATDSLNVMQTPPSDTASEFTKTPGSSVHDLRDSNVLRKPDSPKLISEQQASPVKSHEPYFIVPPGFRANTFFIGMEKELLSLDKKLFDKRRRAAGTASVLLHGQAGAGKSHLARQYVFKNRRKFPGGVFWINARLIDEVLGDFWKIAQKVVATDSPELRMAGETTRQPFVDVVRVWFERQHEWLIVLDGVTIDREDEINKWQKFIPNSSNSSLLYVSRAKRLETYERLLRPQAVKVGPLNETDARKLLLKSIPIAHARDAEIKSATELVRKVGGLPLAIIAISHRIAYTHEPLEKYTIKSYSEDQKIGGRYNEIMNDLQDRNHTEAFNLISVLCFYGPHIPVEMVHLGIRALKQEKVEVRASENGEKPDINTTFGILMRYGLLERNEPDDRESMSSSRSSLVEPEPIDMLKMHTVVQKFCCDKLDATKRLPEWLTYAIRLFRCSYDEADKRIKTRPEQVRISDYREYLVHGNRLRSHTLEYERKSQLLGKLRTELDPTLLAINEEIRFREPSSSQESVHLAEFQISVFDRTSTSSSSGLSETGASHRPPPLNLHPDVNEYGMPLTKTSTDSPRSIDSISPTYGSRIVDRSPRVRYHSVFEDSDIERSYPMEKGFSDSTTRPRAVSTTSQGSGWQIVPPNRKVKRTDYRERSSARAQISTQTAIGSLTRSEGAVQGVSTGTSDAVNTLSKINQQSPPPSRSPIWSRSSSGRTAAPTINRVTYAGVLSGQSQASNSRSNITASIPTSAAEDVTLTGGDDSERGRTRNSFGQSSRPPQLMEPTSVRSTRPPSLARESPKFIESMYLSPPQEHDVSHPDSISSFHPYNSVHQNTSIYPGQYPRVIGPNLSPLPFEENIPITKRHPLSTTPQIGNRGYTATQTFPTDSDPGISNYHYRPGHYTTALEQSETGYYSQPISRDHSHQSLGSHGSEPVLIRNVTPNLNAVLMETNSPRARNFDGSPIYKSPKLGYASPRTADVGRPESHDHLASSDSALLSGTGGWAFNPSVAASTPRYMQQFGTHSDDSPITAMNSPMSRTDSGPGILTDALGMIPFGYRQSVVFGQHEPVDIADARRRIKEYEETLQRQKRPREGQSVFNRIDNDGEFGNDGYPYERGLEYPAVGLGLGMDSGYGSETRMPYPVNTD